MKMKIFKWALCIIGCLLIVIINTYYANKTYAYVNNMGSSVVVPSFQVYVDGIKADKPDTTIAIGTNKPTFFGYAIRNGIVDLLINQSIHKSVITDNTGYWVYTLDKTLAAGIYTLAITLKDETGASSGRMLSATFEIPAELGSSTRTIIVPPPSLTTLNYASVSLTVFLGASLLVLFYMIAKQHKHVEV